MQLHRHTIHSCFKMMKPYIILQFKMTLSIFCHLFSVCIHPYINIPWYFITSCDKFSYQK